MLRWLRGGPLPLGESQDGGTVLSISNVQHPTFNFQSATEVPEAFWMLGVERWMLDVEKPVERAMQSHGSIALTQALSRKREREPERSEDQPLKINDKRMSAGARHERPARGDDYSTM
jgi:hypothetical protein